MMRTYRPMRLAPYDLSPMLRSDLQGLDTWCRQLSTYMARVPVLPQGQPTATTPVAITGNDGSTSLDDYLFLPGRSPKGQRAYGSSVSTAAAASYDRDRLVFIANHVPLDAGDGIAPGAMFLAPTGGVSIMGNVIDFSPVSKASLDVGGAPSQPIFMVCTTDLVNGDWAEQTINSGKLEVDDAGGPDAGRDNFTCYFNTYANDKDSTHTVLRLGASSTYTGKHLSIRTSPATNEVAYMQGADWSTSGRMKIGDNASFTTKRLLDLSDTAMSTTIATFNQFNHVLTLTPTGVGSGSYTAYNMALTDTNTFSSGSYTITGMVMTLLASPPTGVTLGTYSGFNGSVTGSGGGGTVTNLIGGIWVAQGGVAGLPAITTLIGLQLKVGHRTSAVTTVKGIELNPPSGSTSGAVTDHVGIDFMTAFGNGANVTTWHGIRHTAGPVSAIPNKWFLDLTSTATSLGNRIVYKTALGWNPATVSAVTGMLHLGAGTTALCPLIFTTGTSLATPLAGAMEFTTDDLFFTITTGTARKRILFADAVGGLTSGRVPYVTTNGRLLDAAGFTFSGTDLGVPGNITATGATYLFGTAGVATTVTVGQGAGGAENATFQVQAGLTGVPAIYLFQQATEYARWFKDGTNTTWIGTGTLQFQQESAVGTNVLKVSSGGITGGVAGTGYTATFGQGVNSTDAAAIRVRSGDSGGTNSAFFLSRNVTDLVQLLTNGTDTFMDFTGGYRFRSGIGGTEVFRVESTGPLLLGGLRARFDGFTNGAGVAAGTLLNAPAAGNPAFWLKVNIAGTDRFIPCW